MFKPTTGFEALAALARKSPIRLLDNVTVVPAVTAIPSTVVLALLPERSQIVFLNTLVLVAAEIFIPRTADAPVDDNVEIALLLILMFEEIFEQVIPVTAPPVPVDVKLVIVLEKTETEVAVLTVDPIVIPVTEPCPVMFVMVFDERLETPFQ